MDDPRKSVAKTRGRPFEPGNTGKPKGARHRVTRAIEALMADEAEALTRVAIDKALAGDATALKLCFDRLAPTPRDRAINLTLPPIKTPADVPQAIQAVIDAVGGGVITPSEGAAVATLIGHAQDALDLAEIEARVAILETRK